MTSRLRRRVCDPYRLRLPGFVADEEVGFGDIVKRATSNLGVAPCGKCEQRAQALNRWVVISGRRSTKGRQHGRR
jgi:hypothetical protein